MRWLLCAALLLPLSGCVSPGASPSPASRAQPVGVWDAVNQAMEGVPCQASYGGSPTESTRNLKLLSALPVPASRDGTHGELDIRGNLAVHARFDAGGFEVYDIADPLHPRHLGNFTEAPGGLDAKFSPDNRTVLVGTDAGIVLADVSDPHAVAKAGEWRFADVPAPPFGPLPLPGQNAHMLATARIGGADWVFLAPNSGTGAWVLKLGGPPASRTLTYAGQTLPVEGGPLGPHDVYVQKDELDHHWYLYAADGFHGWTAFNVDNPAAPELAGGWANPAEGGYTHTIQAQAINGKRIVATIAEVGANLLRVYDASNLRAPILLGQWQARSDGLSVSRDPVRDPANSTGPSATHPQHNLNLVDGNLFLAYYSYGLYVFNLTAFTATPSLPAAGSVALKPVAHWAVGTESLADGPLAFTGYWDVLVQEGVIYVGWMEGGLLALGYGCHGHLPAARLASTG